MNYSFKQLLERVNDELADDRKWSPSKLRYYLLKVLEEAPQSRGKESAYPELTQNKVLFISKLMESKLSPSIKQIREILRDVTEDELARIADGSEPLEIGVPSFDQSPTRSYKTLSGKIYPQDSPSLGRVLQTSLSRRSAEPTVKDSASDYLNEVLSEKVMFSLATEPPATWQTIRLGPDLEIRHRMKLTNSQKKQLKLTGELLRSILSKET